MRQFQTGQQLGALLLHDGAHHPSDDVAVEWRSCGAHLQQHALDLSLSSRRLVERTRGPSPASGGSVLLQLLLELRQQLMILAVPATHRGVRQACEPPIRVRTLQRCHRTAGAVPMPRVCSEDVGEERGRKPTGVLAALAGWLHCRRCRHERRCKRVSDRQRSLRPAHRSLLWLLGRWAGSQLCGKLLCNAEALLLRIVRRDGREAQRPLLHGSARYEQKK
jgi:hypothetical protein